MKIKVVDAMKTAGIELGIANAIIAYLATDGTSGMEEGDLLLKCFNIVENELALDYIPLVKEEILPIVDGKIPYTQFSSDLVRILKVEEESGRQKPYKIFATYLQVEGERAKVTYAYTPSKKTLDDESSFEHTVSARLLAYGMAAEYSMAVGLYEEAAYWDKKYKEAIEATRKLAKGCKMPSRRWA